MESSVWYVGTMLLIQLSNAATNILVKIALQRGLNRLVYVFYRHVIAMLLLAPFAYVLERKQRPTLTLAVTAKVFVVSSVGTTLHLNIYYAGLNLTSPTVATALSNAIPGCTFLMAVLLRVEKLKIRTVGGWSQIIGTVICIGGSLTFTIWKGGYLFESIRERPFININRDNANIAHHATQDWIKGSTLLLTSNLVWSAWLILQGVVYKAYPALLSLNTMVCFFASIQSAFVALFFARNPESWKLDWNVQLLTIVYSGVASTLTYCLLNWCIRKKGPVFVAMFTPMMVVFVGLSSAVLFAERLHLSSIIGAGIIVVGLYCVLWGKKQENGSSDPPSALEDESTGRQDTSDDCKTVEISIRDHPLVDNVPSDQMK